MHIIVLELIRKQLLTAHSVLDVGSGSGHLTALMAFLAPKAKVTGIEYLPKVLQQSQKVISDNLSADLINRITLVEGDGEQGYGKEDRFDVIHVGFMCKKVPDALVEQLSLNGKMIIPVADGEKRSSFDERCRAGLLLLIEKSATGIVTQHEIFPCSYIPSFTFDNSPSF